MQRPLIWHHEKLLTELPSVLALPSPAMTATIGPLLKRHRSAAGLTQEELAERAEVSARTVSDTERGLRTVIYRDTARRLADALGLDDEARIEFEAAARGQRGAPAPATLPVPPTRLIGREQELEVTLAALETDGVRLLTLTGPGGIGKTRIALEAARRARFAGGVFFVSLGATEDPKLVLSAIAHAVGVTWARPPLVPAIADRLQEKNALIVLDTFEHLLGAASDVAELLASCPGLRVLVTSREALHLRGEHEVSIPTLATPNEHSLIDVERAPASALFLERAQAVKPDLVLDEETADVVAAICQRLNGLPLAIELAAARAKHLPLPSLLDQLENKLNVLTGGPRDLPRRQQTMRDTVGWSYDLLDDGERTLFRELSVFAAGCTLDAARAVCSAASDALDLISALVDKSLVHLEPEDARARFRMLDVIREFAGEKLRERNDVDVRERHAAYFLRLASQAEPQFGGSDQEIWFRKLAADQENFRVALQWSIDRHDAETTLLLAGALWQFWRSHGDLAEGRDWMRAGLVLEGSSVPVRAKALWGAAWLAYHHGDYEDTETLGEHLFTLSQGTTDPIIKRNALTIRGIVAMAHGRVQDACALFEEGVQLLRPLGQNWLLATSLLNLGTASVHARDGARARSLLEEAGSVYDRLGDRHFSGRASMQRGFAWMVDGDIGRAASLISEALRTFAELEDAWGTAECLEAMAAVRAAEGSAERAARTGGAAEVLRATITVLPLAWDRVWTESYLEGARESVGTEVWQSAWDAGRAMSLEDALEDALATQS